VEHSKTRTDRRVQRTHDLLQKAMLDLLHERGYAAITVQDIVDRANVGRTTFYLHYSSKDDLFLGYHEAIGRQYHFGPNQLLSRDELLSENAPSTTVAAYRHLQEVRVLLHTTFQGKDGLLILRRIREGRAQDIEACLRAAFPDESASIPFDVLASYLAGAQVALVQWWLEKRQPCTPETLAQTFHRLQRAAICEACGLKAGQT
jgi:AcrR family transcriptional regulator